MRKKQYCQIFGDNVKQLGKKLSLRKRMGFMQDNHPKHSFQLAMKWLKDNNVKLLN